MEIITNINDIQHDKKMTYDMIVAYINILFENNFEINKMTEVFGENAVSYKQLRRGVIRQRYWLINRVGEITNYVEN